MPLHTFYSLVTWLEEHTSLKSLKGVSIQEKVAIFIFTCGHGVSSRLVQERFQHSGSTISRCFHQVLKALLILHSKVVQLSTKDSPLAERISADPKYTPYFNDCIGALDDTYIAMYIVPATECTLY